MSGPRYLVSLSEAHASPVSLVGGKARALSALARESVPVVDGVVVTTDAYRRFVEHNGLGAVALKEIERRADGQARAEEYWDSSQRIRAAFVAAPWPDDLWVDLTAALDSFVQRPVAVRSSSSHTAVASRSLVRMHDSVVGVDGVDSTLRALRIVWASLYSDRALLYARELGLDAVTSAMAAVIQPIVATRASAVVFTRHPRDRRHVIVEAVDGPSDNLDRIGAGVEPHKWVLDRETGIVLDYAPALGCASGRPPLTEDEVAQGWYFASVAERLFGEPQACEVLVGSEGVFVTESRAAVEPPDDERSAYLAVRLPEGLLEARWDRIETEYLPAMWSEANALSVVDLVHLSDDGLAAEAARRAEAVAHWRRVYRTVLAPFAHGQRLFGEYYVRVLAPADPFEFIRLLVRTPDEYEQRRQIVAELGIEPPDPPSPSTARDDAEAAFLAAIPGHERSHARRLLDLARASWRIRDDDDLYLDRIESEARRALAEIERRLSADPGEARSLAGPASRSVLMAAAEQLLVVAAVQSSVSHKTAEELGATGRPLCLHGDAACPGTATGPARVARILADAGLLAPGDVLVVDALHPEVAAYAARSAAIVERRGGMFAHGAVLAREHGLPCVTGIAHATDIIRDGEIVTVSGDTGTVTVE